MRRTSARAATLFQQAWTARMSGCAHLGVAVRRRRGVRSGLRASRGPAHSDRATPRLRSAVSGWDACMRPERVFRGTTPWRPPLRAACEGGESAGCVQLAIVARGGSRRDAELLAGRASSIAKRARTGMAKRAPGSRRCTTGAPACAAGRSARRRSASAPATTGTSRILRQAERASWRPDSRCSGSIASRSSTATSSRSTTSASASSTASPAFSARTARARARRSRSCSGCSSRLRARRRFSARTRPTASRVRARLGYMPEHDCLPSQVSAAEFLTHMAEASGLPPSMARTRAADTLRHVGLFEERYRAIGGYSTGMKQRVKLGQALVHDPAFVFLDEPTAGLDPLGARRCSRSFGRRIASSASACCSRRTSWRTSSARAIASSCCRAAGWCTPAKSTSSRRKPRRSSSKSIPTAMHSWRRWRSAASS